LSVAMIWSAMILPHCHQCLTEIQALRIAGHGHGPGRSTIVREGPDGKALVLEDTPISSADIDALPTWN
jgi:hypothetical protein